MRRAVLLVRPDGHRSGWLMPEGTSEQKALGWGRSVHPWPTSVFVLSLIEVEDLPPARGPGSSGDPEA
jgi:hypothetical protein